MNNLYRELAPVSDAAWASLQEEAKRTFALHAAARRVTDVTGPDGSTLAGIGTGHLTPVGAPGDGIIAGLRAWRPVVQLRVPFTLSRAEIDAVERGALDPDWAPVKDAVRRRLRVPPRRGPVDRLPVPRRGARGTLLPGVLRLRRLHRRGQHRDHVRVKSKDL